MISLSFTPSASLAVCKGLINSLSAFWHYMETLPRQVINAQTKAQSNTISALLCLQNCGHCHLDTSTCETHLKLLESRRRRAIIEKSRTRVTALDTPNYRQEMFVFFFFFLILTTVFHDLFPNCNCIWHKQALKVCSKSKTSAKHLIF